MFRIFSEKIGTVGVKLLDLSPLTVGTYQCFFLITLVFFYEKTHILISTFILFYF